MAFGDPSIQESPEQQLKRLIGIASQPVPEAPANVPAPPSVPPVAGGLSPSAVPAAPPSSAPVIAKPGSSSTAVNVPPIQTDIQKRQSGDEAELARLKSTGSGVDQFRHKHPVLGTIAKIGDVALGSLFPSVAMNVPGTTAHHNVLEARQEAGISQAVGEQEHEAQGNEANARAQAATQPPVKDAFQEWLAQNPGHPITEWMNLQNSEKGKPDLVYDTDGKLLGAWDVASNKVVPVPAELAGAAKPDLKNPSNPNEYADWKKEHPTGTVEQFKSLGKPAEPGSWTLAEGPGGKTVLFNNKTGEMRDAPAGLSPKGTAAKANKESEPAAMAQNYAQEYMKNGVFTGPGDEALQEKFFELAKPATGFRMSQPQMDMLQNSRGWMNSFEAKARHATVGTWFSDEQRQQIVSTMNALAQAKVKALGGGSTNEPERPANVPSDYIFNENGPKGRGWYKP